MGSFIIIVIITSITSLAHLHMFALDLDFGFPLNCSNSNRLKRESMFLIFLIQRRQSFRANFVIIMPKTDLFLGWKRLYSWF